jgi:dCTP deaminase
MLSDRDIIEEYSKGSIIIDPFNPAHLQPASYDVHLDDMILLPFGQPYTPHLGYLTSWLEEKVQHDDARFDPGSNSQVLRKHYLQPRDEIEQFWIPPSGVALGATHELITLAPDAPLAADIAGCSSLGRWWLFVHVTAGFIDPGWSGRLTLELYNASPWWLRLWAGMRIAQLRFYEMRTPAIRSYLDTGHYAGAISAMPGEYHE